METATLTARQTANLKAHAFQPGERACPIGGTKLQLARAAAMRDRIAPEFPQITASDDLLLWQACGLMAKAQNPRLDPDVSVRLSGTAHRIISGLQRRYRSMPAAAAPVESYVDVARRAAAESAARRARELAADEAAGDEMNAPAATAEAPEGQSRDGAFGHRLDDGGSEP
jgi:hypothetical protein